MDGLLCGVYLFVRWGPVTDFSPADGTMVVKFCLLISNDIPCVFLRFGMTPQGPRNGGPVIKKFGLSQTMNRSVLHRAKIRQIGEVLDNFQGRACLTATSVLTEVSEVRPFCN